MNILMPDLGKVLYLAVGALFGGKLLAKLRG